jgi:2,3-bisphosphoglycerate-dependent phosphoglycerate mutase
MTADVSRGASSDQVSSNQALASDPIPTVPARPMSGYDAAFLTNTPGVTELYLVRHGEQEIDHLSTAADLVDPPLSNRGRKQADLVGQRFQSEHIDVVYSSHLKRAYDTGSAIAGYHGLEPIVDRELREVEVFRDLPQDQTPLATLGRRQLLGMRHRMQTEKNWDAYGYSESSAEFRGRVLTTIEGIVAEHIGERIVVACHGGVIAVYMGHVLGIAQDMWFRPGHTSVNFVRAKGTVRAVDFIGDVNHLRKSDVGLVSY